MRRFFVTALCVLYVAFGLVAEQAHVHGGGPADAAAPGLHLDHAHLDYWLGQHPHQHHHDDHHHDSEEELPPGEHLSDHHHDENSLSLSFEVLPRVPKYRVAAALLATPLSCAPAQTLTWERPLLFVPDAHPSLGKTPPRLRAPPA